MEILYHGTACPIKYFHIGIRGNNLADKLVFVVKRRTRDGLDLSEFTPYVKIESEKDNYYDKDGKIAVENGEDTIRLKYQLRRKTTMYPAFDIQLQFEKPDGDDVVVWQTDIVSITLSRTIPADEEVARQYPTVIQDLNERINALEKAKNYVAKTQADFPEIGDENTLYIASEEKQIYLYDATQNGYVVPKTEYDTINKINGGKP